MIMGMVAQLESRGGVALDVPSRPSPMDAAPPSLPEVTMIEKQYTVEEAAEMMRVAASTMYALVNAGKLGHTKPGKRILIPESAIRDYLAGGAGRACRVKAGARRGRP